DSGENKQENPELLHLAEDREEWSYEASLTRGGDSGGVPGRLWRAAVGISMDQSAARCGRDRRSGDDSCFAADRAAHRAGDLEETMTLLNNDRESRNRVPEWAENFSRRSVIVPVVIVIGLLIGAWVVSSFLVGITRIEAGYVGIEVNLAGSQRGASEIPVRTGWVFYSPLTTQVIEFPTYVQTVKWTRD